MLDVAPVGPGFHRRAAIAPRPAPGAGIAAHAAQRTSMVIGQVERQRQLPALRAVRGPSPAVLRGGSPFSDMSEPARPDDVGHRGGRESGGKSALPAAATVAARASIGHPLRRWRPGGFALLPLHGLHTAGGPGAPPRPPGRTHDPPRSRRPPPCRCGAARSVRAPASAPARAQ